jgi:hypothetical protein
MKKIFAATLAVALVFGTTAAFAQTIAVSADPDGVGGTGPLTQVFDAPVGVQFDLVVWMDTGGSETNAAEFVMTELRDTAPGILSTATALFNNALLIGDNTAGEYILAFRDCFPANTQMDMLRVTYLQLSAVISADEVISVRGFQPGDSELSSFNGEPGFADCSEVKHTLVQGGTDGGITGAQVLFPDGSLVCNPTPLVVPNVDNSMGQLKARF